jgi:hypothetical protein
MTIALFLKVLALVLWFLSGISPRILQIAPYGGSLVAAGLFCYFLPEVLPL